MTDLSSVRYSVGQRVETHKFGWGTVLGFEGFTPNGKHSFVTKLDNGESRVLVELDAPENWLLASESQPHPYMLRSDFVVEGETL